MKKYDVSDIKIINLIDTVRSNPYLYWGVENPTSADYSRAVVEQLEIDNCEFVEILRVNQWTVVCSTTDWISRTQGDKNGIRELFEKSSVFFKSGPFDLRVEFLLYACVERLALYRQDSFTWLKGSPDELVSRKLVQNCGSKTCLLFLDS